MPYEGTVFKGIIHGKTIELAQEPGIPDGQEVSVTVQSSTRAKDTPEYLPPGEGIRRSSGAWAEEAEELGRYIESVYEWRRVMQRQPLEP